MASRACTKNTFRLFQKWLKTCATTRAEFTQMVQNTAREEHWSREELESCLSWLAQREEVLPMPPRLIETVLDQVTVASRRAAAVTRRMSLLHQVGTELAKAAFRERADARITRRIPAQRAQPLPARVAEKNYSGDAPSLTRREHQILQLLGTGQTNRQISRRLGVAERTVKNHLTSLFSKLDAPDRTTAVLTALRHGLISLSPHTTKRS